MYHKHHTKGIVLKSYPEGDSSLKIYILTERFGLIRAKVQSARKINSKMRYGVQDFSFGNFSIVKGRNEWKLVSVSSEKNIFEIFKNDRDKLNVSINILNLIKKLSGEEELNILLFDVVYNFLLYLENAKKESIQLLECLVLLKILKIFGYMRSDPDILIPINSSIIEDEDLLLIAPNRQKIIRLINESLKESNLI